MDTCGFVGAGMVMDALQLYSLACLELRVSRPAEVLPKLMRISSASATSEL